MATLSTSYDYVSGQQTTLAVNITTTQTSGIKLATIRRNGSTEAFGATSGILEIRQERNGELIQEWLSFNGVTVNADNTVTLTAANVSRGISTSTANYTGTGTGQRFNKGAEVRLVLSHQSINNKLNTDVADSVSAVITMATGSSITPTNTTTPVYHGQQLTTTERDALTGVVNGDWIYNTTAGQTQWREGGAWVTNASGSSVSDGSTTVAGKFEEATVAEQGSATATGGTGARLIPANANLVKTSSGAGDENKIAVLNSSGQYANGFLATGTPGNYDTVRGSRTWGPPGIYFGTGADGAATISGNTTLAADKHYTTLTVNNGITLNPGGYRIYVNDTLTLTGTGSIVCPGGNGGAGGNAAGGAASVGAGGTAGAAAHSAGSLPAALAGVAGGSGGTGGNGATGTGVAGVAGTAGNAETVSIIGAGAAGAAGGAGGAVGGGGNAGGAGGAGGSAGAGSISDYNLFYNASLWAMQSTAASVVAGAGGAGGGGGGGGGGDEDSSAGEGGGGGGGGGSGGNGGNMEIYAKTITGSGNITAAGGTGGNGGTGGACSPSGNEGGGGGGAGGSGGSGGMIKLVYQTKTGWTGTATAAGGAGGTGGTGGAGNGSGATGATGTNGTAGTTGKVVEIPIP